MMGLVRFGLTGLAVLFSFGAVDVFSPSPASAQIQCDYGPSNYRRCCSESYRTRPGLGARARADDIDACVKERRRERDAGPAPGPAPRAGGGGGGGGGGVSLRRIECSGTICQDGCAPGEIALSAFCKVGGFPAMDGEQKAYCATNEGSEWPVVLICAKK